MGVGASKAGLLGAAGNSGGGFSSDPNYANCTVWIDSREGLVDVGPNGLTISNTQNLPYVAAHSDFKCSGDFTIEFEATITSKFTFASTNADRLVWYSYNLYTEAYGHDNYTDSWPTGGSVHGLLTRSGSTMYVFINGSLHYTATKGGALGSTNYSFYFGSQAGSNTTSWTLHAARFINGVALHTSSFTRPSTQYLGY